MPKPKRKNGVVIEAGGKLEVTIQWKDAPAFYINECLNKKDKYDHAAFAESFEVVKVEAAAVD